MTRPQLTIPEIIVDPLAVLGRARGQGWLADAEDGTVVALTPKTFEVLLVLLERAGQLVTKEELLASVWPDAFVEENNLARHISTLRKALGEDPAAPRWITTVQGVGYRFSAEVSSA